MDLERLCSWVCLMQTEGVGSVYSLKLLHEFGEPKNFIGRRIDCDFLPKKVLERLYHSTIPKNWDRTCKLIEKYNIKFLTYLDDDYPDCLKNIYAPPLVLFYRGNLPLKYLNNTFAIVGTRRADAYGRFIASKISRELAAKGVIIVSGLAYGVDTIAHRSCLESNGTTIAVMATGCDQIYPPANRELAEKILEKGALVSEYLPGIEAERYFFPQRNRIISALSMGTLVVQGKQSSGSMLTAKYALDQGKELFAIPGQINNQLSEGPNYLIKNGANIVLDSDDIFSSFANIDIVEQLSIFPELSNQEKLVYNIIKTANRAIYLDEIIIKSKIPVTIISSLLLNLELKGVVEALPGSKYTYIY